MIDRSIILRVTARGSIALHSTISCHFGQQTLGCNKNRETEKWCPMLLQARSALRRLPALSNGACGMWPIFIFGIGIFRAHIFIVRFAFLALTEMERTFPENVVPGWLWSLRRRGCWRVRYGRAGAQDDVDHLTSLLLIDFRLCLFLCVWLRVSVFVCVCVCGAQEMLRTMQLKIRFN